MKMPANHRFLWFQCVILCCSLVACGTYEGNSSEGSRSAESMVQKSLHAWSPERVLPSDPSSNAEFGKVVALSGDETTLLVGAPGAVGNGAAYVFRRKDNSWQEETKLTSFWAPERFGTAVALSDDGNTAAVVSAKTVGATGLIQIFARSGTIWSWKDNLILYAADPSCMSLSGNGQVIVTCNTSRAEYSTATYDSVSGRWAGGAVARRIHGEADCPLLLTAARLSANGTHLALGGTCTNAVTMERKNYILFYERSSSGSWPWIPVVGFQFSNLHTSWSHVAMTRSGDTAFLDGSSVVRRTGMWRRSDNLPPASIPGSAPLDTGISISDDALLAIRSLIPHGSLASAKNPLEAFQHKATGWVKLFQIDAPDGVLSGHFGADFAMAPSRVWLAVSAPGWSTAAYSQQGIVYYFHLPKLDGETCGSDIECGSGFCVDGVCCEKICGGTNDADCQVCSKAKGATADGQCTLRGAMTVCRAAQGDCDVAELCTGLSPACPVDARSPRTTTCRPSAGPCDLDEYCDGASATCPSADAKQAAGTVCRPAVGICDAPETCDGASSFCPASDVRKPAGTWCRPATGPCDAPEVCNGSDLSCPADAKKPAGTVCRGSAGVCDVAEQCTGKDDACPNDQFAPTTLICRASSAACVAPAACTGRAASCPTNQPKPKGAPCGGGTDPVCDPGNACDGVGLCVDRRAKDGTPCKLVSGKDGVCKMGTCVP